MKEQDYITRLNRLEHQIEDLKSQVIFWRDRYFHVVETYIDRMTTPQDLIDEVNKENIELGL